MADPIAQLRDVVAGGTPAPAEMAAYLEKVRDRAYAVTDRDVEALKEVGFSEDEIFEQTVTVAHELHHFLGAIAGEHDVAPYGADFEDGYRASEVCDAIVRSGKTGQRETVAYRSFQAGLDFATPPT